MSNIKEKLDKMVRFLLSFYIVILVIDELFKIKLRSTIYFYNC